MAKAEQLKLLIKSHYENDREKFSTLALQLAAYEARLGHSALARDIRSLVDDAKAPNLKVIPFPPDLRELVSVSETSVRFGELIVSDEMAKRIKRIMLEYHQLHKLRAHGLSNRRKLLIAGPPGTGKTMTAMVLANELSLPLYVVMMDKLMSKFMGETGAKLRQIFQMIRGHKGVYLFDEFDAIGVERMRDNDVGEMRRVLNAFLQFIELDDSDSLIIAATNSPMILDKALFRRFDDVWHYRNPENEEMKRLIENRLAEFRAKKFTWKPILAEAESLSHAEIAMSCDDAIKESILNDRKTVTEKLLCSMLKDRKAAYGE